MSTEVEMLRRMYKEANLDCEYCLAIVGKNTDAHELEHIWQQAGKKIDLISNYMSTCRECHAWKHANSVYGRVVAMYWKLEKGEFDASAMRLAVGKDALGWIESKLEEGLPFPIADAARKAIDILQKV